MARSILLLVLIVAAALASESTTKNPPAKCNLVRRADLKTLSNGKKYSFHLTFKNWNTANETCASHGLNVATIRDQNDASSVWAESEKIDEGAWWVSARKEGNVFKWSDGTVLPLDSPLWNKHADKADDCVLMFNYGQGGKLDTGKCTALWNFVCELPTECY
ncbi:uncharacterized protein LOC132194045 [Neocloeon triangulifer]|uniref:uncharacterized protein LOC132194045 n=1 Tax=Neocloeon triangulifer TaxID=2078957 RepID=UPI00286F7A0B|nr:uncharacterized protein LOC132194045 [Neocloeon triangulifer]